MQKIQPFPFLAINTGQIRSKSILCILCPVPRVLCPPGHGDPGCLGGGERGSWGGIGAKGGTRTLEHTDTSEHTGTGEPSTRHSLLQQNRTFTALRTPPPGLKHCLFNPLTHIWATYFSVSKQRMTITHLSH